MSSVKIEGNASGTGIFTIASPNSNTNRTLTLPDVTGTFNTSGGVNEVPAGSVSAPAIYPTGDTNTGVYFPGADRIGFATGGSQRGEFDASGNFQFNSGYGSVATAFGCRAWVNFNGTGTVAIRASGNVTSITDNGVGEYTVNFTTAITDANYSAVVNTASAGDARAATANINTKMSDGTIVAPTTTALRVGTYNTSSNAAIDSSYINVAIFR